MVSDGELAIATAFSGMVDDAQHCHWHGPRDLYYTMWQDGGNSKISQPLQKGLAGVLALDLPKEDFEAVTEQEKDDIEDRMEKAESIIDGLIRYLVRENYKKAATYIKGMKRGMFGYVRRWLKTDLICPRASSLVERVMRELGRRLKKVSYNWSDKGCTKMARIILKKFTDEKGWNLYWKEKLRLDGNVRMGISEIKSL